ncbi:hypothetical protein HDU67_003466 [Dinochytrium kinnereticum]|nr:hypothetical protein HDU67_003466 [Dinochytrium kinnereticum]
MSASGGVSIQVLPPLHASTSSIAQPAAFVRGVSDFILRGRLIIRNKSRVPRLVQTLTVDLSGETVSRFVNSRSFPAEELYVRRKHLVVEGPVSMALLENRTLHSNSTVEISFEILVPESERVVPSCSVAASTKNFLTNDVVLPNGLYLSKAVSWFSCDTWYQLSAKISLLPASESGSLGSTSTVLLEAPILKLPFGTIAPIEPSVVQAYANPNPTVLRGSFENLSVSLSLPTVIRPNAAVRCVLAAKDIPTYPPLSASSSSSSQSAAISQNLAPSASPTLMPLRQRRSTLFNSDGATGAVVAAALKLYQVSSVKVELIQNCKLAIRETGAVVSSIIHSQSVPHYVVSELAKPQSINFDVPTIAPTTDNPEFQISYHVKLTVQFSPRSTFSSISSVSSVPSVPIFLIAFYNGWSVSVAASEGDDDFYRRSDEDVDPSSTA